MLAGDFFDVHRLPDDNYWLLSTAGAAILVDDHWETKLLGIDGIMVGMDDAGRIWVLEDDLSAISAWDGETWKEYGAEEGWVQVTDYYSPLRQELHMDASGNLWYTTTQDVRSFNGEKWEIFTPEDLGMPPLAEEDIVHGFYIRPLKVNGAVWVGQCNWAGPGPFGGLGASWFEGNVWHKLDTPEETGCVNDIAEDKNGNVWLGVDAYLYRYDRSQATWTTYEPPPAPGDIARYGPIINISIDPDGDPWVSYIGCGGASCDVFHIYNLKNGEWTRYGEQLPFYNFTAIAFDGAGTAWIFQLGNGIAHIQDGELELIGGMIGSSVVDVDGGRISFTGRYENGPMTLWALD